MRPRPKVSLREALDDPQLLGGALEGESWHAWRTILLAAMGEPLHGDEIATFQAVTGRRLPDTEPVEELVAVAGRRGGKSRATSVLAAYLATLVDYSPVLAAGERGLALCIAPDTKQSRIAYGYTLGILEQSPVLGRMIANKTTHGITLTNGIDLEVRSASWRRLRGVTAVACIADEACFWFTDEGSANPDSEILTAIRPALATTGGLLAIITTPYARRGETWRLYNENYGPDGDPQILVAQGSSRTFNPSLPERVVKRAYDRDPVAAAAEFGGEWRNDIASFIDRQTVAACIEPDCRERPPERGIRYSAFCDPAGGGPDSFALGISHADEEGKIILDLVREARPPYSPPDVAHEFSKVLHEYGCSTVTGDRYAGQWVSAAFSKRSITYVPAEKPKSQIFGELLPKLNARAVSLLDDDRLTKQLCNLERRVGFSGKDTIGHPPNSHDDLANAAAGAIWLAAGGARRGDTFAATVGGLY